MAFHNCDGVTLMGDDPSTAKEYAETHDGIAFERYESSAKEYTVSAAIDNDEGGIVIGAGTYAEGEVATLGALADDYHQFAGRYKNGPLVSNSPVYTEVVSGDIVVIASFKPTSGLESSSNVTGSVPVASISLSKGTMSLTTGQSQTLTTTFFPINATIKGVMWTSSNTSVATVSSSGLVTAKAVGTAKITAKTNDGGKTATCTVTVKAAKITVPVGKTFTYNGKAQTGVAGGTGYTLSGTTKASKVGKYTATAKLQAGYEWSDGTTIDKKITWKINKAANPLKIKAKKATVKYTALSKKSQALTVSKVMTFSKKGQGKVTYAKSSGNKNITINKKTGKVTGKKGLKKGTYTVKAKVTAAGNANYKKATKTVSFKIVVK